MTDTENRTGALSFGRYLSSFSGFGELEMDARMRKVPELRFQQGDRNTEESDHRNGTKNAGWRGQRFPRGPGFSVVFNNDEIARKDELLSDDRAGTQHHVWTQPDLTQA